MSCFSGQKHEGDAKGHKGAVKEHEGLPRIMREMPRRVKDVRRMADGCSIVHPNYYCNYDM